MRRFALLMLPLLTLAARPAMAREIAYETAGDEVVIDQDVAVDDAVADDTPAASLDDSTVVADDQTGSARVVTVPAAPKPQGIAAYGPFRVIDDSHAALVDVTDQGSPAAFTAMLHDYPGIATLEMIACPGTEDDRANLKLGRMIRANGIATHVPDGGFVGSGAVELFLAGLYRYADRHAEFAVHSWEDESGREAKDYPADAPENRAYLDYYQAVGLSAPEAQAFYAMTNSVPFASAKWLTQADMAQWVPLDSAFPKLDLMLALQ